jgi:hypothetical protein
MLILNSYAYAVIRFLWPISIVLLAGEFLWRRGERRGFLAALLLTIAVLPGALVVIDQHPSNDPREAIKRYFNGRGEQILALNDAPESYQYYLDLSPEEVAAGDLAASSDELARRLVEENTIDLGNLLIDRETLPALTDFWNPHGRLYPWFLVPFLILGVLAALWRARRRVEDRALLGLFWGFSLPLLLTSQVHIGRLIFTIPLLCLFVAGGLVLAGTWLTGQARRATPRLDARLIPAGLAAALIVATGWAGWRDYRTNLAPTHDARAVAQIAADAPARRQDGASAVYVRGGDEQMEVEAITVAGYRLALDREYQFVNLVAGERPAPEDPRPALYFGGLLDRLATPNQQPFACDAVYYVEPFALDRFRQIAGDALSGCVNPPRIMPLET